MWSRKVSACSGASSGEEPPRAAGRCYPHAVALRVRVLQIVCGIGSVVVGAVGWLEERETRPALALGVPAGALAVLAASLSVYCSRGFGGWRAGGAGASARWGPPWRALGPTPRSAIPLALLWSLALAAHCSVLALAARVFLNLGCATRTCGGVAGALLALSVAELAAAGFMLQLDLRRDPS